MNEPRRWLDETSDAPPAVRKLLEAGRTPKPMTRQQWARSVEHIERLEARATLPMKHSFVFRFGPAFAIVLLAALAAAAVPVLSKLVSTWHSNTKRSAVEQKGPRAEKPAALALPQASSRPEETMDVPLVQPDETVDHVPVPAKPSTNTPDVTNAPKTATEPLHEEDSVESTPTPTEETLLEEEVLLLDQARALRNSNPNRALELLDQHAGRFPRGRLGFDRELLTIEALRHAGRMNEARSRAQALLDRAIGKPHEEKMRRLVESLQ